jgi:endonuclease/exonuclease/phosphatase family metal-dependent hydrolase
VAHLERRIDGQEFLLINVHLARGNEKLRTEQATGLREWAKSQSLPAVLAGDCNFDYNFRTKRGNEAYTAFFEGGTWLEALPEERIDTNWADANGDGQDDYPDSSLDFGAFCGHGKSLSATSGVIVRSGDFPDTNATSDHRPVALSIHFGEASRRPALSE